MTTITDQYDTYPYPERDPADEAKRLVVGSPSRPIEMDHVLWGGARDWSRPLRALVAGGGSGDGLVQLAQMLTDAKRPYEITYLDLSTGARAVAEARVAQRNLQGITFHTGSLLEAPDFGTFDYIDCCGVLHHLPDTAAGFAALRQALAPGGGMGFMVYAPHGRSGVYPLQEAFGTLLDGLPPKDRLARARALLDAVPEDHPFKRNRLLVDHQASDAGFYDLLLHSQDRAFDIPALFDMLDQTGWALAAFCQPALYDLDRITGGSSGLDPVDAMAVAEKLQGTLKVHVGYLVPEGELRPASKGMGRIPHLPNMPAGQLAKAVQAGRMLPLKSAAGSVTLSLPREAAPLIAGINGKRTLAEIAQGVGLDPFGFGGLWAKLEDALAPWGLLHYSGLLRNKTG